ncbi:MAG TPA: 30S ribosomal protein S11, partial [Verrucomicrobia bacterium]|nr:30S ribosomal protein S11 [Verrucomicrobiota bacterium]
FKGSRKSTAYAGTIVSQEACKVALGFGLHEVEILVQGPGSGRESAIRAVQAAGLVISGIRDLTPIAHNGCRARKARRV